MPRPVAFVTPTLNRPEHHPALYRTFQAQTIAGKHLYVYDESRAPSRFFSQLRDRAVTYVHRPGRPRIGGVTRIGEARNALNALVREPVILHLDDDDRLEPEYGQEMVDRLGDADLCKLDVWRCLHEATGLLFEWDTRKAGGTHYALLGDRIEPVQVGGGDMPAELLAEIPDWFGFSLVYPKATWERHRFPPEGTEDIQFVRDVRAAGGKLVFVHDLAHLIVHAVGSSLSQHAYPQQFLGAAAAALQAEVGGNMQAAMQGMTELPRGEKITVTPGKTYAVLASVHKRHTIRGLMQHASAKGVTIDQARDDVPAGEFLGTSAPDGYRLVLVIGHGSSAYVLRWKAPGYLGAIDKTQILRAWSGPGRMGAGRRMTTMGPKGIGADGPQGPMGNEGCPSCRNFTWVVGMMKPERHPSGSLHHPSCPVLRRGSAIPAGSPPTGAGVSEGTKAGEELVERFDPQRYANRPPPHRCSAASSLQIARQIDKDLQPLVPIQPVYGKGSGTDLPKGYVEHMEGVVTPMGRKTVPVWTHMQSGVTALQCPYTGQYFFFVKASEPGTTGAGAAVGAGAPPPDFTSLMGGVPEARAAWGPVAAQLQIEGSGPGTGELYLAQQEFANAFNNVGAQVLGGDNLQPKDLAAAAANFVTQNRTAAGALNSVLGLASTLSTDPSPPAIVQSFTGVLIAGAGLAVAAGAVSAGVGAAIVIGLELADAALSGLFGQPKASAQVCSCTISPVPAFVVGCVASFGAVVPGGPKSPRWRAFPSPSSGPGWFDNGSPGFQYGPDGAQWSACGVTASIFGQGTGPRPIDVAFPAYHHQECESLIAAVRGGVLPAFTSGFFAAWKSNQEYALNGLQPQPDWKVLAQYVRLWNRAHAPGSGIELTPPSPTSTSADVVAYDQPCTLLGVAGMPLYEELLVGDMQVSDPTILTGGLTLHINNGPPLPFAPAVPGTFQIGGHGKPVYTPPGQKKTMSAGAKVAIGLGVGVVAVAAGVGIWSLIAQQAYLESLKQLGDKLATETAQSGQYLLAPKLPRLPGLGAAESKKKNAKKPKKPAKKP